MLARSGEPGAKFSGVVGPTGNRAVRAAGAVIAASSRRQQRNGCSVRFGIGNARTKAASTLRLRRGISDGGFLRLSKARTAERLGDRHPGAGRGLGRPARVRRARGGSAPPTAVVER